MIRKDKDIAVIGMAFDLPMAETKEDFWRILEQGKDCIRPLPDNRRNRMIDYLSYIGTPLQDVYIPEGAYLDDIERFPNELFGISKREANLMDPNQRLFLRTSMRLLEDAGYSTEQIRGSNTGIFIGHIHTNDYLNMIEQIDPESLSTAFLGNCSSALTGRLSYVLDLKGPNMIIETSCSSSLTALHIACQSLRSGECTMAITGGVQIYPMPVRKIWIGIESKSGRSKSFSNDANGTGAGEGIATLLLKTVGAALADRDQIYAIIKGSAVNHDGFSMGLSAPNPSAQADVIERSWQDADVPPRSITYIEAHGTGTNLGDPVEIKGITQAFRKHTNDTAFCAVSSVKSNIGHLDGAAGIAGIVKAILQLQYGKIVPTVHFNRPNKMIDFTNSPVYISSGGAKTWVRERYKRRCGVSSFGVSGSNCHVVLEEYTDNNVTSKTKESLPYYPMKDISCWITPVIKYKKSDSDVKIVQQEDKQSKLCGLFMQVLGTNTISINDNFYNLGGDSIMALDLLQLIEQEFNVKLTINDIYIYPTVSQLLPIIQKSINQDTSKNNSLSNKEYPLSLSQKRLYAHAVLYGETTQYNITSVFQIVGDLDVEKLRNCWKQLVSRHDSLRTSFHIAGLDIIQRVHTHSNSDIVIDDISTANENFDPQKYIMPFYVDKPELLRAFLIKENDDHYYFLTDIHHIITDGISNVQIMYELMELYKGHELPLIKFQYSDFVYEQIKRLKNEEVVKARHGFWKHYLDGCSRGIGFPGNLDITENNVRKCNNLIFTLNKSIYDKIQLFVMERKTTPFIFLISVYSLLLSAYTDLFETVIGTSISERTGGEFSEIVGMCVNTIAIRSKIIENETFNSHLKRASNEMHAVYANHEYSYDKLMNDHRVPLEIKKKPLFPLLFVMQNYPHSYTTDSLEINPYIIQESESEFDIIINIYSQDNDYKFRWTYLTSKYTQDYIQKIWDDYRNLLIYLIENTEATFIEIQNFIKIRKENNYEW